MMSIVLRTYDDIMIVMQRRRMTEMTTVDAATGRALNTTWKTASTRIVSAGGIEYAYRELGPRTGVPVVFLTHLAAVLDNWDPRVVDGIAARHRVITFDNRGVGASSGSTPKTIEEMGATPSPSCVPSASIGSTCSGS